MSALYIEAFITDMPATYSVIISSGCYIPEQRITNDYFLNHTFYEADGSRLKKDNAYILEKFSEITGIYERRYANDSQVTSDLGALAAKEALASGKIDGETLDYIIVAHNFGDVRSDNRKSDMVPSLASRIKNLLEIQNPNTVCYDLPFGCAGWLQGVIQADTFIKSGITKRVLVIGAETLSRICDPHDRDSLIYSDGAGAVVLEGRASELPIGVLAHRTVTHAGDNTYVLKMQPSYNPEYPTNDLFLKMRGRVLYEHALKFVPTVIRESLERAGIALTEVDKIFIHQANNKMDEAILKRLFAECGVDTIPDGIMPMTISWLGNSSVATVPTVYDLVIKGKMENQHIKPGSIILFVAVGAGVNINSLVYRVPE
jgi:3-oxoacyl-[acyl-carrier-protein] synthase-3